MANSTPLCVFCGVVPAASRRGKTGCEPKYCGSSCRAKAGRRARGEVSTETPVCVGCGVPIIGAQSNRRTCSKSCHAWVRRHPGVLHPKARSRHCAECGASIDGRDIRSPFCSALCRGRNYDGSLVGAVRHCDQCGQEFRTKKKSSLRCSEHCSRAADYAINRAKYLASSAASRARRRSVRVETFQHEEIFDRDGWVCYLCENPVDPTASWPHPMMPSIDHVIPISRGGEHSRSNVRCAHLGCNLRKGSTVLEVT